MCIIENEMIFQFYIAGEKMYLGVMFRIIVS
jgi:hypothetical protein